MGGEERGRSGRQPGHLNRLSPVFWLGFVVGWLQANYYTGKHRGINAHLASYNGVTPEQQQAVTHPGFVILQRVGDPEATMPPPMSPSKFN